MNKDILEGKWKELRGHVKEMWGKLTDDDLDKIQGRTEQLAGALQERYGYARDRAEKEIKRFIDDHSSGQNRKKSPDPVVTP